MSNLLKLRPEVKEQWLAALRSGEYEQCQSMLRSADDGFCCLGVLCDLHSKTPEGTAWREDVEYKDYPKEDYGGKVTLIGYKYWGQAGTPPAIVMLWAFENFTSADDRCVSTVTGSYALETETLAGMNDSGYTFEDIANVIEEQL